MREIDELIWHCTATPAGRETTVAEIDRWHKARGWSGIGYHKVVHLDGSVSDGRPESQVGAHVANRNARTIGYVYVGGVDADDKRKARDTRTPAQKRTMERLTREAIKRYGLTMVSGHSDYANKACPSFNARAEYAHLLRPDVEPVPVPRPRPEQPDDPGVEPVEPPPAVHVPWWKSTIAKIGATIAGALGMGSVGLSVDAAFLWGLAGLLATIAILGFVLFVIWVFAIPPRGKFWKGVFR